MITPIINQPRQCRQALTGTASPVVLDLETTGLGRQDRLVSVGLLIDAVPYILFVGSRVVQNVIRRDLHTALEPLTIRKDLTVLGHNIGFDLGVLWREKIKVVGIIHDTEKLLRLHDPDRGKNQDVLSARLDRKAPAGSRVPWLNYRLKDVVGQLLSLRMVEFDNSTRMDVVPYAEHVLYLTSDLVGTKALYDHLIARLS